MEPNEIENFTLVRGKGDYSKKTACLISASVAKRRLLKGEPLGVATDEMDCICPTIRALAIGINDASWWTNNAERTQTLMPFIDRVLDTNDPELLAKRAFLCADRAVRVFAPLALEAAGLLDEAEELRSLSEIVNTASIGWEVMAARDAASVASGAWDAAWCAWDAESAARRAKTIKGEALQLLADLCDLSRQGGSQP